MSWTVELVDEAKKEIARLDKHIYDQLVKTIRRVALNPLPGNQGGYGKPLGKKRDIDLTGLQKIKFKQYGIRIVYKTEIIDQVMKIIIISMRADDEVYKEAYRRRLKYGL